MEGLQIAAPEKFNFNQPEEWSKWFRRFERYMVASGLSDKTDKAKINSLVYCMGDKAEDILISLK